MDLFLVILPKSMPFGNYQKSLNGYKTRQALSARTYPLQNIQGPARQESAAGPLYVILEGTIGYEFMTSK